MRVVPIRLAPASDLRLALEQLLAPAGVEAGWVLSGIGSLSPTGAHLHLSVADPEGRVMGGHLACGSRVRTTAEVLVALLPQWRFSRELDPATGFAELRIEALVGDSAP